MSKFFKQVLGPYSIILNLVVLSVAILTLSRIGLSLWQWDRVSAVSSLSEMLLYGIRADLIMTGMLFSPLVLLAPILANRFSWQAWKLLLLVWGSISLALLIFMEVATPTFILEYDLRPNRLFIEYLTYPKEVGAMLWNGYRFPLILGLGLTFVFTLLSFKRLQCWLKDYQPRWSFLRTVLVWPLVVFVFVVMVRSTLMHRPANPALFSRTSDALVNSLYINSAWSVYFAIYNLKHEDKSSAIYGDLDQQIILETLRNRYPWLASENSEIPTLHHQTATYQREKPLNLVIVLEESLSGDFVESLGGKALTPNLDALKSEGWWFENLYATGTRSVRGIEAVISGFPPTPARSVVKLSLAQQNFFTVADYLKRFGYHTEFVYGGESHFDNMASFFIGNGFDTVIDERDFEDPIFTGSWGASDQDLFNKAHERITSLHETGQPFLSFIFSSSNHSPYEYPDNVITQVEHPKQTRNNAVVYSDHALGEFIRQAKNSAYWKDTVFLIVADHCAQADGENLVPIEDFHIPGVILGADIQPKVVRTVSSQIDLAPTLMSMMGISGKHPMIGRDLTKPEELNSEGRALMQFSDYFALMEGNQVTILRPAQPAIVGEYDPVLKNLTLNSEASEQAFNLSLAHSLLPSWLYRTQKYTVKTR